MKEVVIARQNEQQLKAGQLTNIRHTSRLDTRRFMPDGTIVEIKPTQVPKIAEGPYIPLSKGFETQKDKAPIAPQPQMGETAAHDARLQGVRAQIAQEAKPQGLTRDEAMELLKKRGIDGNSAKAQRILEGLMNGDEAIQRMVQGLKRVEGGAGAVPGFDDREIIDISAAGIVDPMLQHYADSLHRRGQAGALDAEAITEAISDITAMTGPSDDEKRLIIEQLDTAAAGLAAMKGEARVAAAERRGRTTPDDVFAGAKIKDATGNPKDVTLFDFYTNRDARYAVFNNLMAIVDGSPHIQFREAFDPYTVGMRHKAFLELLREGKSKEFSRSMLDEFAKAKEDVDHIAHELEEDWEQFQQEFEVRQVIHDVNQVLYIPNIKAENLYGFIDHIHSRLADIPIRTPGVKEMMDLYEANLRKSMAVNDGVLRPEDVYGYVETKQNPGGKVISQVRPGEVEKKTKEMFRALNRNGGLILRDKNGQAIRAPELSEADIERIYILARGFMIADLRLISIVAESRIPPKVAQFQSLTMQDILQSYSHYIHLQAKYGITKSGLVAYTFEKEEPAKSSFQIGPWTIRTPFMMPYRVLNRTRHEFQRKNSLLSKAGEGALQAILDSPIGKKMYLRSQNPNRAGDIFTWTSGWRINEDPTVDSMSKEFLIHGRERMLQRLIPEFQGKFRGRTLSEDEIKELAIRHEDVNYADRRIRTEDRFANEPASFAHVVAMNAFKLLDEGTITNPDDIAKRIRAYETFFGQANSELPADHPDNIQSRKNAALLSEYANWLGTGVRIERLREDVENRFSRKKEDRESSDKAIAKMLKIFKRVTEIQPHRIYLASYDLQNRLRDEGKLREFTQTQLTKALDDLEYVEKRMFENREKLLDEGYTFDGDNGTRAIQLDFSYINEDYIRSLESGHDGHDGHGGVHMDFAKMAADRRAKAEQFKKIVMEDYTGDHKVDGKTVKGEQLYRAEWVQYREALHGFVPWSGDVPIDELHFSKTGETGLGRRARDNKDQGEAAKAELELISALKSIKTPEEAVEYLSKIYSPLNSMDASKAKKAMIEKAEMIMKYYSADWAAQVPILGPIRKLLGRASAAEIAYGKTAASWDDVTKRHMINLMRAKGWLDDNTYKDLALRVNATKGHTSLEAITTVGQLLLIAFMLYLMSRLSKDVLEGK